MKNEEMVEGGGCLYVCVCVLALYKRRGKKCLCKIKRPLTENEGKVRGLAFTGKLCQQRCGVW